MPSTDSDFWNTMPGMVWELERRGEEWIFTKRHGEVRPEQHRHLVGRSLFDIVPRGHPVAQQILDGIESHADFIFMDNTTPGRITQSRCKPILDTDGCVCRLVGVTVDITESFGPQLRFFNAASNQRPDEWQTDLDQTTLRALERPDQLEKFFLCYQPIVDLSRGPTHPQFIRGVETLIRMRIDDRIIPPLSFLPVIARNGWSSQLTQWVIAQAFREIGPITQERPDFRLAINLGIEELCHPEIVEALSSGDFPTQQLKLELIETAQANPSRDVRKAIFKLRERGIRMSVDDFGTQHSNFDRLSLLAPGDLLKIDRSFIPKQIADRETSICTAMIWVAKVFQLQIVAEGIETAEQSAFMRTLGADHGQGFFFYRPMELEPLRELLSIN